MALEDDFPLHGEIIEPGGERPATPPPPESPRPMVIVQYRRNWSAALIPPILLLLVALALLKIRVQSPDWGWWSGGRSAAPQATVGVDAHPSGESSLVVPGPLVAHLSGEVPAEPEPVPSPEEDAAESAPPPEARPVVQVPVGFVPPRQDAPPLETTAPKGTEPNGPSPFDLTVPLGGGLAAVPDPATATDALPPAPAAGPAPLDEDSLAEEARRVREERERLAALKDRLIERDRQVAAAHRVQEVRKTIQTIESSRSEFIEELREIVQQRGVEAGPMISSLCERHGRTLPRLVFTQGEALLKSSSGSRMSPRSKVQALRGLGWPESMILEELARAEVHTIGSRRGPKNKAEVLVVAAIKLLAVPLEPSKPTAASIRPNTTRRSVQ